jgi:hypothetical protein
MFILVEVRRMNFREMAILDKDCRAKSLCSQIMTGINKGDQKGTAAKERTHVHQGNTAVTGVIQPHMLLDLL